MADGSRWIPQGNGQHWADPHPRGPPQAFNSYSAPPPNYPNQVPYQMPIAPPQGHPGFVPGSFKILQDCIISLDTSQVLYTISRPGKSSSLSGNSAITISHMQTNAVLGTFKIHSFLSNDIDLSVNGRETTIKDNEMTTGHADWSFKSSVVPERKFWWFLGKNKADDDELAMSALSGLGDAGGCDDDDVLGALEDVAGDEGKKGSAGTLLLKDAKKGGRTLARVVGDVLTIVERPMNQPLVDEVLVSAVAMAEAAKKKRKEEEQALKVILKVAAGGL